MNYRMIRDMFVYCRQIRQVRIAFVAGTALILLTAGLAAIGQSSAAGHRAEIRATGTFSTSFSPNIADQSVGNLNIFSRYSASSLTGSFVGTAASLQTIARDDVVEKKAFQTNVGSIWGTLAGLKGSFSTITHVVADRSQCVLGVPCPANLIPIEGNLVVVDGTGKGELEGICGGGTIKSALPLGSGTDYDFIFRFGEDCKANK